jgi:hypothetical protein
LLSSDQINVLYALIHNPKFNLNAITKYLNKIGIEISYYTVQKTYGELINQGILRNESSITDPITPGNTRLITHVEGNYVPEKLGLIRQHVVFRNLSDNYSVNKFKEICDIHPYTHYRTLLIGSGLHGYAQFDIPNNSASEMYEFYSSIRTILNSNDFQLINHHRSTYSELKLDHFNHLTGNWDFHIFSDQNKSLEKIWETHNNVEEVYLQTQYSSIMEHLNPIEIQLIRELTINANVKAQNIHKFYQRDRTTISKYLKKLETDVMGNPTLYYDRSQFDLSSPQMIIGEVDMPQTINKLHRVFGDNRLPFRSEIISDGPRFIIILMVPPSLGPEISYFVWTKTQNIEMNSISLSLDNSWRYPFYPENYDIESSKWKTSKEYINTDIINKFS